MISASERELIGQLADEVRTISTWVSGAKRGKAQSIADKLRAVADGAKLADVVDPDE